MAMSSLSIAIVLLFVFRSWIETNALCPDGYRCPLGVESPQKCTQFEQCRGEGHARGNAYSFAAALSGIVLVSFLFTGNFWAWIHRHIMLRKAIDRAQRAHGA